MLLEFSIELSIICKLNIKKSEYNSYICYYNKKLQPKKKQQMQEAFIVTSTEDDDINPESDKFILRDLSDNISPKDMIKLSLPNIIDQLLISEINNNIFNFDDIQRLPNLYSMSFRFFRLDFRNTYRKNSIFEIS